MLHAIINCKSYEFRETGSILEAARAIALDIPTLCHDERLKPAGACRCAWLKSKDGSSGDFLPHAAHRRHGHPKLPSH